MDKIWSDDYEDDGYTEGCVRNNASPSTKQTDFSLRVVKTYGNTKSHAGHKEDSWEVTGGDTKGCNLEGTLVRSEQTLV